MFSRTKKSYIFLIILFVGCLFSVCLYKASVQKKNVSESIPLTVSQYKVFHEKLLGMVNEQDPRVAMEYLHKMSRTNPSLMRSCHVLVHEIGRSAFLRYGDFAQAMSYRNEECNSGYLHGAIEEALAKSADPLQKIKDICSSYKGETYLSWECYHGIGHGLMLVTDNELLRSIVYCNGFETHFMQENCANGVYMENFNTDQKIHVSRYLDPRDPFVPCETQPGEYQKLCYLYAPIYFLSLYPNQYNKALSWCLAAPNAHKDDCVSGVGSQIMKEQLYDTNVVEEECNRAQFGSQRVCIAGAATFMANNYGRTDEAKAFCETLTFFYRSSCANALKGMDTLFATQ